MRGTIQLTVKWMVCSGAVAVLGACSWMPWASAEDPTVVPFKTLMSGSYQGFLKRWNESRQPVFCALIRSRAEWDTLMEPIDANTAKPSPGPSAAHFETRQYLVVGRTMRAPDAAERPHVFTPLSVTLRDGALRVNYLYREPASQASYRVADYMMLSIPKERYAGEPVLFYENDRQVCRLDR